MPTFNFCTYCGAVTNSWSTFALGIIGGLLRMFWLCYYFRRVETLGLGWNPIMTFFCFVWDTWGQILVYGDILSNKHKGTLRRQFANVPVVSLCRGRKACLKTWVVNVVLFVHLILKNHYVVPGFRCPFYDYSNVLL